LVPAGPHLNLHILYLQRRLDLQTPLRELLADSDLLDDRLVALGVQFEVFRQLANPLAEQRDLDFRAAGIGSMRSVLSDEVLLMFGG
jgi:hypothetical protein